MEGWLLRQQITESARIPLVMLAILGVAMAFWFEATRALTSAAAVLLLPFIALRLATRAVRDSELGLARFALGFTLAAGALAELALAQTVVGPALAGHAVIWLPEAVTTFLLAGTVLAAVPLEVALTRQGVETRLGAWTGVVAAFTWLTPRMGGAGTIEALFGVVTFAVVLGGGVGLTLGALARYLTGARV